MLVGATELAGQSRRHSVANCRLNLSDDDCRRSIRRHANDLRDRRDHRGRRVLVCSSRRVIYEGDLVANLNAVLCVLRDDHVVPDRRQHRLLMHIDNFPASAANHWRQRSARNLELRSRDYGLIELDLAELTHDPGDRPLTLRHTLDPQNSGGNDDLSVLAEVRTEHIRHVAVANARDGSPWQFQVHVVVDLISRLNDGGLDAWAIDAGNDSSRASWSAATLTVRRCLDFASPDGASARAADHVMLLLLQRGRGAAHWRREDCEIGASAGNHLRLDRTSHDMR